MKKRLPRNALTVEEIRWLQEHGYALFRNWISIDEGYECKITRMGDWRALAYRSSIRALYNFARKHYDAEHPLRPLPFGRSAQEEGNQ